MDIRDKEIIRARLSKIVGRAVRDDELERFLSTYSRSTTIGEQRLVESISTTLGIDNFSVRTKVAAASDNIDRLNSEVQMLLNKDKKK